MRDEAGFSLIDLLFVVALIGVLCSISIPALARAKGSSQAAAMIADMRLVNSAQLSYAITCGSGFYAKDLPTLGLKPVGSSVGFVNEELATAVTITRRGYTITLEGTPLPGSPGGCSGAPPGDGAPAYRAGADSITPINARFFATNANGIIWEDQASLYAVMPQVGDPPVGAPIE
jgi:type II secretory pathway pseudopilin PulG